jgi:hypothetical protein
VVGVYCSRLASLGAMNPDTSLLAEERLRILTHSEYSKRTQGLQ